MLELITDHNREVFERLIQDYEEEFSPLTGKTKKANGQYDLDTDWRPPNEGYCWKENSQIMGFVIKDTVDEYADIGEFYIIPAYRKKGIGRKMAFAIFDQHRGLWQVRQIQKAELAKKFWRSVINEYTGGNYVEIEVEDPLWGTVYCQRFASKQAVMTYNLA